MYNFKRHTAVFVLLLPILLGMSSTGISQGQDTLFIDLRMALELAWEGAPDMIYSQLNDESALLNMKLAKANYYFPRLDMNLQTPSLEETQTEASVYDATVGENVYKWSSTKSRMWYGNLALSQPLPTGGDLSLVSTFYENFRKDQYADDETLRSMAYRLEVSQDFLNGNQRKRVYDRAKLSYDRTRWGSSRSRRQLAYQILQAYYSLLTSQRSLEISSDDLEASSEMAQLARNKYEAGLIPESEALQLEVEVLEKEATLATEVSTLATSLEAFRITLGLDLDRPLKVIGAPQFNSISIDLDNSVALALAEREDLRQHEINVDLAEFDLKDAKRDYGPSGSISAFYYLDRREDQEWNALLNTPLGDYQVNRGVTVSFAVPIWTAGRRSAAVQMAKVELRRSQFEEEEYKRSIILDVRKSVREIEEAERRYQTSLRALELAEVSYGQMKDRFENGQVSAREWSESQLALKRSRINALNALIDHLMAVAGFRLATGQDVVPWQSEMSVSPLSGD